MIRNISAAFGYSSVLNKTAGIVDAWNGKGFLGGVGVNRRAMILGGLGLGYFGKNMHDYGKYKKQIEDVQARSAYDIPKLAEFSLSGGYDKLSAVFNTADTPRPVPQGTISPPKAMPSAKVDTSLGGGKGFGAKVNTGLNSGGSKSFSSAGGSFGGSGGSSGGGGMGKTSGDSLETLMAGGLGGLGGYLLGEHVLVPMMESEQSNMLKTLGRIGTIRDNPRAVATMAGAVLLAAIAAIKKSNNDKRREQGVLAFNAPGVAGRPGTGVPGQPKPYDPTGAGFKSHEQVKFRY